MPFFERSTDAGTVRLHYEVSGSGFPVLAIAPGGMRSAVELWNNAPWNPALGLSDQYQVIAMDQRNAGRSTAPVTADDGWSDYTADQLALLDHLGVERCHVVGMCIGGSFGLGLINAAPERVAAAVLYQPIGFDDNREAFYAMFDSWAQDLAAQHPALDEAGWSAFRARLYDADFVFNLTPEEVRQCQTPLLIPLGNDLYHPRSISDAIVRLAPRAEALEHWKAPQELAAAEASVREFLARHTPAS